MTTTLLISQLKESSEKMQFNENGYLNTGLEKIRADLFLSVHMGLEFELKINKAMSLSANLKYRKGIQPVFIESYYPLRKVDFLCAGIEMLWKL